MQFSVPRSNNTDLLIPSMSDLIIVWSMPDLIHYLSHPFVLSLQISSLFNSLFNFRCGFPYPEAKYVHTLIQTFFGLIVIWSMGYLLYALSDPCVIWSIRYLIHALSDPCFVWSMRYLIYMLSNLFVIRSICYLIHLLFDPFVIRSICYLIHLLSDPFVIWSICYLIHSLSDPFVI